MQRTCKSSNLCAISYSHLNSPYSSKHTDALSLRSHGRACAMHMPSPLRPSAVHYLTMDLYALIYGSSFLFALHFYVPCQLAISHSLIFGYWPFSGPSLSSIFGSCIVIQSGASPIVFISAVLSLILLWFLRAWCLLSACSMDVFHTMYVCIL